MSYPRSTRTDEEELGRRDPEDEVDNFPIRWDLHILDYRIFVFSVPTTIATAAHRFYRDKQIAEASTSLADMRGIVATCS